MRDGTRFDGDQPFARQLGRISQTGWPALATDLDREGWALLPGPLNAGQCDGLAATTLRALLSRYIDDEQHPFVGVLSRC